MIDLWTRALHAGYTGAVRPLLFKAGGGDPEFIHEQMVAAMGRVPAPIWAALEPLLRPAPTPLCVGGVDVANPIGLAAGLDKNGLAPLAWQAMGFGFVELGTVTPRPQPGNPSPRLFRLVEDRALINRMGFNNEGAAAMAARLDGVTRRVPIGVSLGKNKDTPNEQAVDDYLLALQRLRTSEGGSVGDYVVVNVSSPNTPGLRALQSRDALGELFTELIAARPGTLPIWVKVAPELTWAELDDVVAAAQATGIEAIIATNTTLARTRADGSPLASSHADQTGGLSGAPLTLRAAEVVDYLVRHGTLPVVASGGVMNPADIARLRDLGASLVQLYSGFIYSGPALVRAGAQLWQETP